MLVPKSCNTFLKTCYNLDGQPKKLYFNIYSKNKMKKVNVTNNVSYIFDVRRLTIVSSIVITLIITMVMISCGGGSSIDSALSQVENAMNKVEKNKTSMTEADWKALSDELEPSLKLLNDALESKDVSALKKIKISAVVLRYAAVASEAAFNTVADSLKVKMEETHLTDSIAKAINQVKEMVDSNQLEEVKQELQKSVEDLQKN